MAQSLDFVEAVNESKVVIIILRDERNDPMVWDELLNRAKDLASGCKIELWALFSRKSRELFGPEKPVVKLQSACFENLLTRF